MPLRLAPAGPLQQLIQSDPVDEARLDHLAVVEVERARMLDQVLQRA